MKKTLFIALFTSSLLAQSGDNPDHKAAQKKFQSVQQAQINKYKNANQEFKAIIDDINEQTKQLLNFVVSAHPECTELSGREQHKKMVASQQQLKQSNPEFRELLELRKANYKKRNELLLQISPDYKEAKETYYRSRIK